MINKPTHILVADSLDDTPFVGGPNQSLANNNSDHMDILDFFNQGLSPLQPAGSRVYLDRCLCFMIHIPCISLTLKRSNKPWLMINFMSSNYASPFRILKVSHIFFS